MTASTPPAIESVLNQACPLTEDPVATYRRDGFIDLPCGFHGIETPVQQFIEEAVLGRSDREMRCKTHRVHLIVQAPDSQRLNRDGQVDGDGSAAAADRRFRHPPGDTPISRRNARLKAASDS